MTVDWNQLKVALVAAALSLGIDQIGFASAEPFLELRHRLERHRNLGRESGFEHPDLEARTVPVRSLPQAQSIIAIAVAYPARLTDAPRSEPGARRGVLSRSAWGMDYHAVLRERLARLEEWLRAHVPAGFDLVTQSMVDTGALSDRAVAERAGIGWIGKNSALISPQYGSWLYLGELLTNVPFEPDEPIEDGCASCTACIDACPTGALVAPYELDAQKCISYLTQTKGLIAPEYMKKIGNRLYGCDTCQTSCPKNKGMNWTHHPELRPDPEQVKPLLEPILQLSNRAFKEQFGSSAAAWRGRKPIQRNALIGLGHFREATAMESIGRVLREDERFELRATAAWALGRMTREPEHRVQAEQQLQNALEHERHEEVRQHIEHAIAALSVV